MPNHANPLKSHKHTENKGRNSIYPLHPKTQNCATRGVMAQLKTQWRNERGAN
jgi:hypothetical protein